MALDYDKLMAEPPIVSTCELTARDTMLYALGVGVADEDPTDPEELKFVYEHGLKALPTMAVVLTYPGYWAKDPKYGVTWQKLLHGEQSVEIHKAPLPVQGRFKGITAIDEIYDKGIDKGAVLCSSRCIYSESGEHLATTRQSSFLRADGGFGGRSHGAPKPHSLPERSADIITHVSTRLSQALLYRLSGDYNPLHADPRIARQGGFERPILHGLATYGIVGRALLKVLCGNTPERMQRMDVRFSSPVYPGERLEIEAWREGTGRAAFRVRVPQRNLVVLQNGYLEFIQ